MVHVFKESDFKRVNTSCKVHVSSPWCPCLIQYIDPYIHVLKNVMT